MISFLLLTMEIPLVGLMPIVLWRNNSSKTEKDIGGTYTTGKYGTGFQSTYRLSKKVTIKG